MKANWILILFFSIMKLGYAQTIQDYAVHHQYNIPYNTIFDEAHTKFTWNNNENDNLYEDDFLTDSTNIGFTFTYHGVNYTKFKASINGFLTFNHDAVPFYDSYYTYGGAYTYDWWENQFSLPDGTFNSLAPLYADASMGYGCNYNSYNCYDSTLIYKVVGTSPNKVLTVEWRNLHIGSDVANFQVKIYELDDHIEYRYGNMTSPNNDKLFYGTLGMNSDVIDNYAVDLLIAYNNNPIIFGGGTYYYTPETYLPIDTNTLISFTLGNTPCSNIGQPTNLMFTTVQRTRIEGKFNRRPNAESYYVIRTNTNVQPGLNQGVLLSTGTDTTFIDDDLAPNTTYYYWVFSVDALGCSGLKPFTNLVSPLTANATTLPCTGASGTISIGPAGTFTTLTAALNSYKSTGLTGPTILQLSNNYNPASETYPIVFNDSLHCLNSINNITVRPISTMAVAKNISSNDTVSTIRIQNASYITIDGRKGGTGSPNFLNIENTDTLGISIEILDKSQHNTIQYSIIKGVNRTLTEGVITFKNDIDDSAKTTSQNKISNCYIQDGLTTPCNLIYSKGYYLVSPYYSSQNINRRNVQNNEISNCNIYNFFSATKASYGILADLASSGWTIRDNSFYQTLARNSTAPNNKTASVKINDGDAHLISRNYFGGRSSLAGGNKMTYTGSAQFSFLDINASTHGSIVTNIDSNFFRNIFITSTSGGDLVTLGSGNIDFGVNDGNVFGGLTAADSININMTGNNSVSIIGNSLNQYSDQTTIKNNSIKNLKFIGTNNPFYGINIDGHQSGEFNHVIIENNTIGNPTGTINSITLSTNGAFYGIYANKVGARVDIDNNELVNISRTSGNAHMYGIYCNLAEGKFVDGNIVRNFYVPNSYCTIIGIWNNSGSQYSNYGSVTNNEVTNLGIGFVTVNSGQVLGIYGKNLIENNFVSSLYNNCTGQYSGITGILVPYHMNGTDVINNRIRLGINNNGTPFTNNIALTGIEVESNPNRIYHNSVYVGGNTNGSSNTYCLLSTESPTGVHEEIYNNIFMNVRSNPGAGSGYAISLENSGAFNTTILDHNIYYTSGTNTYLGRAGSIYPTLSEWQNASRQDFLSGFYNPNFLLPTGDSTSVNLHINSPSPASNFGKELSDNVPFDTDDQTRNENTPDAGADEGSFAGVDVLRPAITYASLPPSCNTGDRLLVVTITDSTGVPTSGALRPRIYYKKGSSGSWFDRVGTLNSGNAQNGTWNFTIVAGDMGGVVNGDIIYYFVVAEDNSLQQNIGSFPFGAYGTETNVLTTFPSETYLKSYIISTANALSGNYNVGTGQIYPTITDAFTAYNNGCIEDDVTFLLTDSIYNISNATLNYNITASENSTLTVRPTKTNTVITGNSIEAALSIKGGHYITIDGSFGNIANDECSDEQPLTHLTIINAYNVNAFPSVVLITSSASFDSTTHCTIKNCIIKGGSSFITYGIQVAAY
ncbi:MAG: fibronectin type III domain-containing protein, partial [Saprospiraceae bacterium]|nr:fibronectin type III domain-containing protein [Saprospiraceae bacterium]